MCCCGCCPGCSGSFLPLGVRVLRIMFATGPCQVFRVLRGSCLPLGDVCPVCSPGCSGSCLPLGGVRVLSRVLCRGAVQGAPDHACHCQGVVQNAFQGAPDHVCHWAVSVCCPGCCSGCSKSFWPLGGDRVLSRVRAPYHVCYWAVSGCC